MRRNKRSPPDACAQPVLALGQDLRAYQDATDALDLQQIAALPPERFAPLAEGVPRGLTPSAVWLRLELQNHGDALCRRWLSLDNPRLDSVQVHVLHADGWQSQRAGGRHLRDEGPAQWRQAVFPIEFAAGEQALLLVRVQSYSSVLLMNPLLRDEREQARWRERTDLVDGMVLGIALMLVAIGVAAAIILRSPVTLAMCVTILCNLAFVSVAQGYLLFWLPAQPYIGLLILLATTIGFVAIFAWLWLLFGLRRLPRAWNVALALLLAAYFAARLFLLSGGYFWNPVLSLQFARATITLVYMGRLAAFFAVLAKRLRHDWMAWLAAGLLILQIPARWLDADRVQPWEPGYSLPLHLLSGVFQQSTYSMNTLPSQLLGFLLLAATIVRELFSSRRRATHRRPARKPAHAQCAPDPHQPRPALAAACHRGVRPAVAERKASGPSCRQREGFQRKNRAQRASPDGADRRTAGVRPRGCANRG